MEQEQRFEEFVVTARKWRPQHFNDVVGQEHITTTLINAIKNRRIHHAYLFSGPRGVGKTTTARILARAINCLNPKNSEPCNECASCVPILESRSLDVIEIDGASNNSVDDIRKLRENAKYPPVTGKYKMYIIDEVHMLSTSAFNALLKTLEEPPPHLMFVFATTEPHKVPATILSRCQRFEFHRMEIENITKQLGLIASKEGVDIDEESLITIAKKADGSMRDSQSIFDQVVAFCGKKIDYSLMADALHLIDADFFFSISDAVLKKNVGEMFGIAKGVITKGYDFQECLGGLLEHYRNILSVKVTGDTSLIESSASYLNKYKATAESHSRSDILRIMNLISQTEQALRFAPQPRVRFELALVQMASMDSAADIKDLLEELRELKKKPLTNDSGHIQPKSQPVVKQPEKPVAQKFEVDLNLDLDLGPVFDSTQTGQNIEKPVSANIPEQPSRTVPDAETLKQKWNNYLEKYAGNGNELSLLRQTSQVISEFFYGEIILKVVSEFLANNLEKKKTLISTTLNDFFKSNIKVKIVADNSFSVSPEKLNELSASSIIDLDYSENDKENNSVSSNINQDANSDYSDRHPIEKAIIDVFKAKDFNI